MAWDKAVPASSTKVKVGWPQLLANQVALETAIDQDHDFTTGSTQTGKHTRVTLPTGSDQAGVSGSVTIWNNGGVVKFRNGTGTIRILAGDGDVIPAGTKMWFYANSAPAGWTIDSTPSDELLAVKGGSTYTTGATEAGSWTQADHTHTTGDHAITSDEMPAHVHAISTKQDNHGTPKDKVAMGDGATATSSYNTASTGGGSAHNHGATGGSATVNTWRPLAAVGIICSKDAY